MPRGKPPNNADLSRRHSAWLSPSDRETIEDSGSEIFHQHSQPLVEGRKLVQNQDAFQYVTNREGEKSAVILPISEFEALLEDLRDLATVAERRDEPTIPHDELHAS